MDTPRVPLTWFGLYHRCLSIITFPLSPPPGFRIANGIAVKTSGIQKPKSDIRKAEIVRKSSWFCVRPLVANMRALRNVTCYVTISRRNHGEFRSSTEKKHNNTMRRTVLLKILWVLPLVAVCRGKNSVWIICIGNFTLNCTTLTCCETQNGTEQKTRMLSSIKLTAINYKWKRWDLLA